MNRPSNEAFRSRRGVLCFKPIKKVGKKFHVSRCFIARFWENKKEYVFTLPPAKASAGKLADEIRAFLDVRSHSMADAIQLFDKAKWERMNPTATVATVGDIIKAHEGAEVALGISSETAKGYREAIMLVFRQGLGHRRKQEPSEETIKASLLTELTPRLIADFKVARVEKGGEDMEEVERKKRSANGVLRNLSALFSEASCQHYTHLTLPDGLTDTLSKMSYRKVGKSIKRLPPAQTLRDLFEEVKALKITDRNAYLGFLLAAHAGLRLGEVAASRHSWIDAQSTPPRIYVRTEDDFVPKSKHERFIEVQPWLVKEIVTTSESPGHILSSHKTERGNEMPRRLNAWLKKHGLEKFDKPIHALRFFFGSYVANKHGIYRAQKFLGHESPDITNEHYADLMLDASLYDLWEKKTG
jgi:integrase